MAATLKNNDVEEARQEFDVLMKYKYFNQVIVASVKLVHTNHSHQFYAGTAIQHRTVPPHAQICRF